MVIGSAAYPILDAIMIFPLAMIYWSVRRINNRFHNFNWIWDILFNSDHLCIASALIGYKHFFSFKKVDELQH
jgi:hypothetical protein